MKDYGGELISSKEITPEYEIPGFESGYGETVDIKYLERLKECEHQISEIKTILDLKLIDITEKYRLIEMILKEK